MLFYPPKELSRERKLRYRVLTITFFVHFFLFIALPWLLSFTNKIVINISNFSKTKNVSFVLSDIIRHSKSNGINTKSKKSHLNKVVKSNNLKNNKININSKQAVINQKKNIVKKATTEQTKQDIKKNNSKIDKKDTKATKVEKKEVLKTAAIAHVNKKVLANKSEGVSLKSNIAKQIPKDDKKVNKAEINKLEKEKKIETVVEKIDEKKAKAEEPKVIEKDIEEEIVDEVAEEILEDDGLEVSVADQDNLSNIIFDLKKIISLNLKVPQYFIKYMPLEVSFDIDSTGKPQNLVLDNKLPIILKQSVKHSIFKSNFSKILWGTKNIKLILRRTA